MNMLIDDFISIVNSILRTPGMYNVNNVDDLGLIIWGYKAGVSHNKPEINVIDEFMSNFREFVNSRFETNNDYDWVRVLRFNSSGMKGSLDLFKSIFDEFLKKNRFV